MFLHYMRGKSAAGTGISQRGKGARTALEAPATPHQHVLSPRAQLRIRHAQRLLSVLAAQPKPAEASHGSSEGEDTEYDPLRDGPLRFLGYSNEVGEAFGMLIPPWMVAASYAVAISYVLVDTVDKFARARSSARSTLTLAAAAGDNMNAAELQAATTAAAFTNADPADPPHLTKSDKVALAASSHKDVSSTPTTAAGYAPDPLDEVESSSSISSSSSSSSTNSSVAVGAAPSVRTSPQLAPTPSPPSPTAATYTTAATAPPAEMFAEALPFSGAAPGGGTWDSGYSSSSSGSSSSGGMAVSGGQQGPGSGKSGLDRGLDNAAGIIDAAGVVSGTGGGAGSFGSRGGNAGVGGGLVLGTKEQARLSREEENAALVVGGLKALDTVVWQMLASVMIPGFIIHQSVHLATHSLSSPACMKTLTLGASAFGRLVGMELSATLPGYIINTLPVALGLALIPIICHPIDSVVDKLLDSTLRPVLRKYRLQLQQEQQQRPAP